jgi:hypothetical protein
MIGAELTFCQSECAFGDVCGFLVFPSPGKLFDLLIETIEVIAALRPRSWGTDPQRECYKEN